MICRKLDPFTDLKDKNLVEEVNTVEMMSFIYCLLTHRVHHSSVLFSGRNTKGSVLKTSRRHIV